MHDAGLVSEVQFGGGFCTPSRVSLTPEQVVAYLSEGLDYVLGLQGIDPSEYEEWQATDGLALCMETPKSGKLCGNQVASQCDLPTWKNLHRNSYCHLHGGLQIIGIWYAMHQFLTRAVLRN